MLYRRSLLAASTGMLLKPYLGTAAGSMANGIIGYGITPPPSIPNVRGDLSPLGWTVGLFDDFSSFSQSITSETVTTSSFTWLAAAAPGWYGQGQELIVNAHQAAQAGISGAATPFLEGGFSPFSCADSILSITAFMPTAIQLASLKQLDAYRGLFPQEAGGTGTNIRTAFSSGVNQSPIISGALCSAKRFAYTPGQQYGYGYFECNLRVPAGANGSSRGLWSSFWLNYTDADYSPEIDVWEQSGDEIPQILESTIWFNYPKQSIILVNKNTCVDLSQAFHTFGCLWTPYYIATYLDGNLRGSFISPNIPPPASGSASTPMESEGRANDHWFGPAGPLDIRILFSLGQPWAGGHYMAPEQLPSTLQVDWVRYSLLGPQ
jgi:hypothetical protein